MSESTNYVQTVCAGCGEVLDLNGCAWRDMNGAPTAICWKCADRRSGTDRRSKPRGRGRRSSDGGTDG